MFGLNMIVNKGKTIFIVIQVFMNIQTSKQMAEMAISAARVVKIIWI